ncbi:MAG: hypothetical protein Kow00114_14760 [Kiloniellaceae bacterium]
MLSGVKPLAMFSDGVRSTYAQPDADFSPYVAEGTFVRREEFYQWPDSAAGLYCLYFARKGEEWRIEALHRIQERLHAFGEPTSPEIERQIGRLLGYSDADIDQFLEWISRREIPPTPA